jgi:type II secretion system protein N
MSAALNFLEAPIPRPVLWIGTPIAALFLITIFVFMGFPYDMLAGRISAELSAATGSHVLVGDIEPRITIAGPGASLRDVRITPPGQETYFIDPLRVRPAWSLSWLSAEPALQVDFESPLGAAEGTLTVANTPSWDGEISGVDIAQLPLQLPQGVSLSGVVSADADIIVTPDGPAGDIEFEANEGVVGHPSLPIDLQYERIVGDVTLGGEHFADIRDLRIDGPVLSATAGGTVSRGNRPGRELLDLAIEIEIKTPPLQQMVRGLGVPLDGNGRASFNVGGTLAQPSLR